MFKVFYKEPTNIHIFHQHFLFIKCLNYLHTFIGPGHFGHWNIFAHTTDVYLEAPLSVGMAKINSGQGGRTYRKIDLSNQETFFSHIMRVPSGLLKTYFHVI